MHVHPRAHTHTHTHTHTHAHGYTCRCCLQLHSTGCWRTCLRIFCSGLGMLQLKFLSIDLVLNWEKCLGTPACTEAMACAAARGCLKDLAGSGTCKLLRAASEAHLRRSRALRAHLNPGSFVCHRSRAASTTAGAWPKMAPVVLLLPLSGISPGGASSFPPSLCLATVCGEPSVPC